MKKYKGGSKKVGIILISIVSIIIVAVLGVLINIVITQQNEMTALSTAVVTLEVQEQELAYEMEEAIKEQEAKEDEKVNTLLESIKTQMEDGNTTLTLLENCFPDDLIVGHEGAYLFIPIDESLNQNDYIVENLEKDEETGEITYLENEEVTSRKGIDVSKFQGNIEWDKVANDGVDFTIIRLGYRGNETGKLVVDETYEANIEGATEEGLDVGVYFYTEAITVEEAIEEADFVIENLGDYELTLPVVIDVEESASEDARSRQIDADERTEIVLAFCDRIEEAGYETMIYGNLKSFLVLMNIEELEGYGKWFAYYKFPLRFPYEFQIWQYTASGTVDGIKGGVDMNIAFY
ncbi:MAG: glycoside hydrolase family 25 protein [Eubacteriales bacterium]